MWDTFIDPTNWHSTCYCALFSSGGDKGNSPVFDFLSLSRLLSELFPGATELYERVAANREQWTKVSHKFTIRGLPSNNSLDFLDQEYELLQAQGAFGSDDQCLNGCLDDGDSGSGQ